MYTLTGLKLPSFACKCEFYRPEHNRKGDPWNWTLNLDLPLIKTLLFGDNLFSQYDGSRILEDTIGFIVSSKSFDDPFLVW